MSGKSTVRIGTGDGLFYCSEVLACVLLKLLPQYKDASIARSQNQSVLNTCNIVVGVGGKYDPARHRYDHHMKEFQETMSTVIKKPGYDWTEKLSSAGLIYCHFGHEILKNVLSDIKEDKVIEEIFKIIYEVLIKEIDAVDSVLQIGRPNTDLSGRVSRLNTPWANQNLIYTSIPGVPLVFGNQFDKAIDLVREEFLETVQYAKNIWLLGRDTTRRAMDSRFEVDSSGEIILFTPFLLCKERLLYLEKEMNVSPSIKYVIYEARNLYCIECMPEAPKSSARRTLLPESWRDLERDALVKACGIEGALSVSFSRTLGVHKTKEGAMAMARKALHIEKTMCSKANRTRKTDDEPQTSKRRA